MPSTEQHVLTTSLDTLLATASVVAWVVFVIYAIVSFVLTLRRRGLRPAILWLFSFQAMLPLAVVLGISLLSASLVFVYPPQAAVVESVLTPGGVRPLPLRAGLHWIFPILEHEVRYPISWQTYTMTHIPTETTTVGDDAIRARTNDGQEVRLACSVIFRLDIEQLVSIHIDWQHRYVAGFVRPVVRSLVRRQVSQYTVREVNSAARKNLEAELERLLQQQFADRGLTLDQFLLRDLTFTDEYAAAVEHKQVSLEGQEQKLHEAQQLRNVAQGRADALTIEAQAEAKSVELISEALRKNPDILTYHYINKLAPNIRVMLVPNNAPLLLPLPRMDGAEDSGMKATTAPPRLPVLTPTAPTE